MDERTPGDSLSIAITEDFAVPADAHPLLRFTSFRTEFAVPLDTLASPGWLVDLLRADAAAPFTRSEGVRSAVRDLLRHGGYKPTGRGKPASEYLVRAAEEGTLASINAAVDVCNAVSLHSGLPISVVDLDRAHPPFRIGLGPAGSSYIFNAAGQEIDVTGLLCLFDADGPCANAVKDAQRTKTTPGTRRTLSIVWADTAHSELLTAATIWYRSLLSRLSAAVAHG